EFRQLGLDMEHGVYIPHRSFETDFHRDEMEVLKQKGIPFSILIPDVQSYYTNTERPSEVEELSIRSVPCDPDQCNTFTHFKTPESYTYGSMGGFHTLKEMNAVLDEMRNRFPDLISKRAPISNETTLNGGKLEFVKIGNAPKNGQKKPEILFTALHHAREPVSLSQMLFFMWYLLENYENDPDIRNLVDNVDAYFIPCINPDG